MHLSNSNIVISKDYCCTKPVIYLKFRDLLGDSYESIKSKLQNKFIDLFQSHRYLLNSEKIDIINDYQTYLKELTDCPN